jgi:hypothetical protein
MIEEGPLDRRELSPIRQSLDSPHFGTIGLYGQYRTRLDRFSVEKNRAGMTGTGVTASFCARQSQLIPQDLNEQPFGPYVEFMILVINGYPQQ